MASKPRLKISQGDIWLINFDPTLGDEIQKTRPGGVISVRSAFQHRLQIVVPITIWQPRFAGEFWMIRLVATPANSLDKDSAANAFQVKSVSEEPFLKKLGVTAPAELDEIAAAIALCVGYDPRQNV